MQLSESALRKRAPGACPKFRISDDHCISQLPPSFSLTLTGGHFVSSLVILFNGTTLSTLVVSSSQLTATITSSMISGPGSYNIQEQTPAGTSGDLGCSSGGKSSTLTLTDI